MKFAIEAGHSRDNTPGKRCLKSLDPNETREWILNDRVVRKVIEKLSAYEGIDIMRADDPTGKVDISLEERCRRVNNFKADFFLSVHYNAGLNGKNGGGTVAFSYTSSSKGSHTLRDKLYNAVVKETGLIGNRSTPKATANFYVLKHTSCPAVLLENGFMDSPQDIKVILTEQHAEKTAIGIVNFLVAEYKLKKKEIKPIVEPIVKEEKPSGDNTGWRVVIGYFENIDNANACLNKAKANGFPGAYLVEHKK